MTQNQFDQIDKKKRPSDDPFFSNNDLFSEIFSTFWKTKPIFH